MTRLSKRYAQETLRQPRRDGPHDRGRCGGGDSDQPFSVARVGLDALDRWTCKPEPGARSGAPQAGGLMSQRPGELIGSAVRYNIRWMISALELARWRTCRRNRRHPGSGDERRPCLKSRGSPVGGRSLRTCVVTLDGGWSGRRGSNPCHLLGRNNLTPPNKANC